MAYKLSATERASLYKAKAKERQDALIRSSARSSNRAFNTALDVGSRVAQGAVKSVEGIVDFAQGVVGAVGGWFDKDFQAQIQKNIEYDWTMETFGNAWNDYTKTSYLNDSKAGEIVQGVASGIGQMLPSVAVTIATGGMGAPATIAQGASLATLGIGAGGNSIEEAYKDGAGYYQGLGYGALSGGVEVATEKMFGGAFKGITGGGYLDDIVLSTASKGARTGVKRIAKEAVEEGLEEVASELVNPTLNPSTKARMHSRIMLRPSIGRVLVKQVLSVG